MTPNDLSALPSPKARAVAFGGVWLAGMLGALAGFGVVDLQCDGSCALLLIGGAMIGALIAAAGASVLAVIALRAMPQWRAVDLTGPEGGRHLGEEHTE